MDYKEVSKEDNTLSGIIFYLSNNYDVHTKDHSGLSAKLNQAFEKNIVLNFSVGVGELLCNPFVCSGLRGSRLPKRKNAKSDARENVIYGFICGMTNPSYFLKCFH